MTFKVRDSSRDLQFDGVHLSHSSSQRPEASRWIEFDLYRTESGQYVLSRVGKSLIFHSQSCRLVDQYGLHAAPVATLLPNAAPCEKCDPELTRLADNDLIYPETERPWAQVYQSAAAVLRATQRYDEIQGSWYFTRVARSLLEEASQHDAEINRSYHTEIVA